MIPETFIARFERKCPADLGPIIINPWRSVLLVIRRSLCLCSPQVLRNSQEAGNDRTALLHPFKRFVQLLHAAGRVHDELLLGRRTRRVPCAVSGCSERVGADAGLSELVGERVYGLIECRQVR